MEEPTERAAVTAANLKEEIYTLKVQIKVDEEELKEIKTDLENTKVETAKFCDECEFNFNKLRTACGARKNYLTTAHGKTEEVAIAAVAKWDPNCMK